jgi:hypothetical protein
MPALATPQVDNDLYNRLADAWWSEQSELYGSVATFHLRGVPLCCFHSCKVVEGWRDRLQG